MQIYKIFGILVIFFCSFGTAVAATYAQVIVSEVYPAPGVGESEWIELYNASTEQVDLTGFVLFDQLSSPSLLYTFTDQLLDSTEYLLVDLSVSKLNNSGDGVELRDAEGNAIDLVVFDTSLAGQSWQRISLANAELVLANPTPEAENTDYPLTNGSDSSIVASPTPTPTATTIDITQISIESISACPSEGKESLALSNQGADLYLDAWQIIDAAGNQKLISGLLPSGEITSFDWTGSLLNNSGDSLELVTDQGILVASAAYDACTKGIPLIKVGDAWLSQLINSATAEETASTSTSVQTTATSDDQSVSTTTQLAQQPEVKGAATIAAQLDLPLGKKSQQIQLVTPVIQPPNNDPPNFPSVAQFNPWSSWSVIMGGLLQLLPSSYLLYAKVKLISLPPPIFA